MGGIVAVMVISFLIPLALSITMYVLSALGLYTIARRRGIRKPWLSWIPVGDAWIMGSLSDQYRYVTREQNKSKRKVLLTLYLVLMVVLAAFFGLIAVILVQSAALEAGMASDSAYSSISAMTTGLSLMPVPMMGIGLAALVVRYMALYDVLGSLDPDNAVLFLVISIVIPISECFFLYFNRNSDRGMVRRTWSSQQQSQSGIFGLPESQKRDPWDQN